MNPPLPTIHARILAELSRRGWSLRTLSQESGVPYSSVHSFAAGGKITTESLGKILDALELELRVVKPKK